MRIDIRQAEAGQDTGTFTVTRTDNGNTAAGLIVRVTLGGSATHATDYSVPGVVFLAPPEGLVFRSGFVRP